VSHSEQTAPQSLATLKAEGTACSMNVAAQNRNNMIGICSAVGASIFFSFNDMAIKFLSGDYALHQIVLIRSTLGMLFLMMFILPFEGGLNALKTKRLPVHVFRGLCVVVANMTFFLGLAAMPLAGAVGIFFISPLVITVFSVIFLGETVGPRRWLAVGIGFVGVVIMLRPGSGSFQVAALLPLTAAFAYAGLHIMTRKIGGTEKASTMTFYIQLTFIAVSAAMGLALGDGKFAGASDASLDFLLREWSAPQVSDYVIFVMLGLSSTIGGYLISQAYRSAEAGLAAPFEYVAMPMAIFWGVLVFGEWPDKVAWIGISLIIGGGLYAFLRELVQGRMLSAREPKRR
jgi:drug/metabolite transporter (DMT)-like permease